MTRVLVVGAGGFVGANLMRDLMRRPGVDTHGWMRPGGSRWRIDHLQGSNVSEVDIAGLDAAKALRNLKPDVVINAAAHAVSSANADSPALEQVNGAAPLDLLRAAQDSGSRRFIQLGSYFEYGDRSETLHEDDPVRPKTPYAASKAKATQQIATARDLSTEAVVLRLFNLWGAWEASHRLIPQVIRACRAKELLALTPGTQLKDFTSVRDIAHWIGDLALRAAPIPHRIVNVASGRRIAVRDLVSEVARELHGSAFMQFGAKQMPEGEPQTGPADLTRLTALLPNRHITSIAETLGEVLTDGIAP